jgi:uncharacterized protein (TIGR04222 family)
MIRCVSLLAQTSPSPLDWKGPDFLLLYMVALIVAAIWCGRRADRALARFDGRGDENLDPFEMAFLSAGPGRVVQLAITRLIHAGLLDWVPSGNKAVLKATSEGAPGALHPAEQLLLDKASMARGLPVGEAGKAIAPAMRSLEVVLATRGLRPTAEERKRAAFGVVIPLVVLFVLGLAKLLIGLEREKPVLFLVALLFVTFFLMVMFAGSVGRLTPSGQTVLTNLRARNEAKRRIATAADGEGLPLLSGSVALFGPSVLASVPLFAPIHTELESLQAKAAKAGSSSGCSSGCGSDVGSSSDGGGGCGSGCGGCGGGGD